MNTKRKTLKMPVRYLMNAVLVALLFVGLSFLTQNVLSTYQNKVLLTVGINIILAVSLNVATGYLGQLPLGHAGFMAVGAYTCALFTKYSPLPSGISFAIGLVLACIMAGLFGMLIGIPALRLTGDYLAILTLGFGEIIRITLNNIDDVLGYSLFYGSKGLTDREGPCHRGPGLGFSGGGWNRKTPAFHGRSVPNDGGRPPLVRAGGHPGQIRAGGRA